MPLALLIYVAIFSDGTDMAEYVIEESPLSS